MISRTTGDVSDIQTVYHSCGSQEENAAVPSDAFLRAVAELLDIEPEAVCAEPTVIGADALRKRKPLRNGSVASGLPSALTNTPEANQIRFSQSALDTASYRK